MQKHNPARALLPVSAATALSLLGDTTLYTVLPTHTLEAGISMAGVGILLSANRWIRLPLNGPAGWMLEKLPRKPLFVVAMLLGAVSTWLYAVDGGYPLLLAARLLWGVAWVGIWVGGNTIVLDLTHESNRGKWVGLYQIAFYAGAGGGALLGGLLVDGLGYHAALAVQAGLTTLGALAAALLLPETRGYSHTPQAGEEQKPVPRQEIRAGSRPLELVSATALMTANRLVQEGFLLATLALFLDRILGPSLIIAGRQVGSTTLSGMAFGMTTLVAAISAPLSGAASDRTGNRWRVAAAALLPGALGFLLLAGESPLGIVTGLIGVSIAAGSSANLSTALIGDLGPAGQHGRRLGGLFTIGDLASAAGPPLAFALAPMIGLPGVYSLSAGIFAGMALVAFIWGRSRR